MFLQHQGWLGSEHREADSRDRQGSPLRPPLRLLMALGAGIDWLEARSFDKGTNKGI